MLQAEEHSDKIHSGCCNTPEKRKKKKALSLNEWIQVPRSLAGQLSQRHLTRDNVEKSGIVKVWVIRETKGPSMLFIGRKEVSSVLSDT